MTENNQVRIILSASNISKRHDLEVELRHERNRMQVYLNTMHTILVITDRHGIIIKANRQFIHLVGSTENEIINKSFNNFCPKRSHTTINNYIHNLIPSAGNTVSSEFPLVANTGKEYTINWRITLVAADSENSDRHIKIIENKYY
jgi:PAS domain S-box-containing protein